jgi:muconate cycloisomerase
MASTAIKRLSIYPLSIPMRQSVEHAANNRQTADPIIVAVELMSGVVGYGETLPRPYVTGESPDSVIQDLATIFVPHLLDVRPNRFPEALEFIDNLPWRDELDRPMPAARAALELALIDAYADQFHRPASDLVGWLGLPALGSPGSIRNIRYSGVLASTDVDKTMRTLKKQYWFGLRHFKLKVGDENDHDRLTRVADYLAGPLRKGTATLRIDVNGAWTEDQAIDRLVQWRNIPIAGIEQPLPADQPEKISAVRDLADAPIFHDESLVLESDAHKLIAMGVADGFNIRISKNGGLLAALKLAALALKNGTAVQLGCMVGETAILSSAGMRFLEWVPRVEFAEGCFGRFLLEKDVIRRSFRFGYAGKPPARGLPAGGFLIAPEESILRSICLDKPLHFAL